MAGREEEDDQSRRDWSVRRQRRHKKVSSQTSPYDIGHISFRGADMSSQKQDKYRQFGFFEEIQINFKHCIRNIEELILQDTVSYIIYRGADDIEFSIARFKSRDF
jgi:hypothetical protein